MGRRNRKNDTVYEGYGAYVGDASLSPDERLLLAGTFDGAVVLSSVVPTTNELILKAKEERPRCLSPGQRAAIFLDTEPPAWCIDLAMAPFKSKDWQTWLRQKREGKPMPQPSRADWD